jgi:hypothetical protein
MPEIVQGLKLFADFEVDCVVVGGVAAGARGSSQATFDVDVCYARDRANLIRLANALRSVNATLRGAPKDIPFILDEETLRRGLNFTFDTDIGKIDILGEVQGVGLYDDCFKHSDETSTFPGKIDRCQTFRWENERSAVLARARSNPRISKSK